MPSRSTKISLLLIVDVVFFFVELTVGYAVGSLALVADSFHMLKYVPNSDVQPFFSSFADLVGSDVISLIVALYAIRLSKGEASPQYSYGWHRAEIVAALINGVFLLALCFSIFLEAIERFFSTPEISNPKMVVIVGTLGLASNFFGLILFHDHDHSHEQLPKLQVPGMDSFAEPPLPVITGDEAEPDTLHDSFAALYGHPVATRASVVQAAQEIVHGRASPPPSQVKIPINTNLRDVPSLSSIPEATAMSHLGVDKSPRHPDDILIDIDMETRSDAHPVNMNGRPDRDTGTSSLSNMDHDSGPRLDPNIVEPRNVRTNVPRGSSHGSMNMQALILHVIGDALGNVGVIATGLVIWLSTWQYKFYFDPVISLVITAIIFSSALPLVLSASIILLQAVPSTISIEDLRKDIRKVEGVRSVHELHVWQLSENKLIASLHVLVSRKREYMLIAYDIRKLLHDYNVHSSTIQPEFYPIGQASPDHDEEYLITAQETDCLITCPPNKDCSPENTCCPPQKLQSPKLINV